MSAKERKRERERNGWKEDDTTSGKKGTENQHRRDREENEASLSRARKYEAIYEKLHAHTVDERQETIDRPFVLDHGSTLRRKERSKRERERFIFVHVSSSRCSPFILSRILFIQVLLFSSSAASTRHPYHISIYIYVIEKRKDHLYRLKGA